VTLALAVIATIVRAPVASGGAGGASAESCRVCHSKIYAEWKQSWHARSTQNRNFTIALDRWVKEGRSPGACFSCHAPAPIFTTPIPVDPDRPTARPHLGPYRPGTPPPNADADATVAVERTVELIPPGPGNGRGPGARERAWADRAAMSTVDDLVRPAPRPPALREHPRSFLAQAMVRQPLPRTGNLQEGVNCQSCHEAEGGVMIGPYDVGSPHRSQKELSIKTLRACVSCHGQPHSPCQKQVQSYELSAVKTKVICQSCHMPLRDDRLAEWINFDLPIRRVASHAWPGVHDPGTLASAIRPEVEIVDGLVVVSLTNRGAGHHVPASPWRKLIALVQVYDAMGREVYRKRDGFFQERGNAIPALGRETITFLRRANHASVKVTLHYRFYPNQPDLEAARVFEGTFAL
jgi:hypothetical protein